MKSDKDLTKEQYQVCRLRATEAPFSGKHVYNKEPGIYNCVVCDSPLFSSTTKFDSGSGWPSFYDVLEKGNVKLKEDQSHGMTRTEVVCATCDAHLGHVFDDLPVARQVDQPPGAKRYCISSVALEFREKKK